VKIGQRMSEDPEVAGREGAGQSIRIADLKIFPGSRQVFRDGGELAMSGHTFDFLMALIDAAPDIATADMLAEQVWGGRPVSPETINQRAKLLRDALSEDSGQPRYFTVVRGQGYRLIATPEVLTHQKAHRPLPAGLLAAVLLLVVLTVAAVMFWPDRVEDDGSSSQVLFGQAYAAMQQHSAQGLQTAVDIFSQALAVNPDDVHSLTGLAQARLMQARYRLLDRPVAERLAADLLDRAADLDPESPALNSGQGLLAWHRGQPELAEEAFREALRLDPRHDAANLFYGLLLLEDPTLHRPFEAVELWRIGARSNPDSVLLQAHLAWTDWRAGRIDQAERDLHRLIEIEPELTPAHFTLGELYLASGRQAEAIRHYRRVLELNRYFTPLAQDGLLRALLDLGLDESIDEVLVQLRAMPEDGGWWSALYLVAGLEGELPGVDARDHIRRVADELAPQRPVEAAFALAMIEMLEADFPAARAVLEQGAPRLAGSLGELPVDGYWRMLVCPYAYVLVELGETERGRSMANWLLNRIETGPDLARFEHLDPLVCHTALGNLDQALHVLERVSDSGLPTGWRFLRHRPDLSALQQHPRFKAHMDDLDALAREQARLASAAP
jgi:tetratricopeptide (TPR) repeat protein